MTTANKITLVRILMIPAFVLMAIYYGESIKRGEPIEWQRYAAIVIFLVAAASDGLDGYIARRYNQKSALGVILDPIADKGLLLSAIITLSISNWSDVDPQYGQFPDLVPGPRHQSRRGHPDRERGPAAAQRQGARCARPGREKSRPSCKWRRSPGSCCSSCLSRSSMSSRRRDFSLLSPASSMSWMAFVSSGRRDMRTRTANPGNR